MDDRADAETVPDVVYDVVLAGRPSESLRSRYPAMTVQATRAQTALRRQAGGPGQLDDLLEKLCSLGLQLLDVHRVPGTAGETDTYEVHVDGEVGESLVSYLRWSHHVVPGQTRVRISAASDDLHGFLQACTKCGERIERVRRVDPIRRAHGRDSASAGVVSRGPADGRDAPRPRGG